MFVESSLLQSTRPRAELSNDTSVIPSIWLPNYSKRIELVDTKERCFYDGISKRVITIEATKTLRRKFDRALSRLLLLFVGIKFRFWYNLINRDAVKRKTYKRYYPQLINDNVTDLWAHRKGFQIIVPYLVEIYRRKTRMAFRNWKLYLRDIRMLMMRMFNRWNVKASRWKLNRLNAARFLRLTEPWGRRIRKALRKYYWPIFRHACDLVLIRRHVKLLFRCWHTVVIALRRGRKLVKHRTLVLLWENRFEELRRQEEMTSACNVMRAKYLARKVLRSWRHVYRHHCLIKRVLMSYCNSSLRRGWVTWVKNAFPPRARTPPQSPRRRPPPAPIPMPEGYRKKYTTRLPRVPPHIVVPLAGLHSYAMVHSPGITEADRIHFRLQRLEHHVQVTEERQKQRMTASGGDLLVEVGQAGHKENVSSPAGGNSLATPSRAESISKTHNSGIVGSAGRTGSPGKGKAGSKSASKVSTAGRPPSGRPRSAVSTPQMGGNRSSTNSRSPHTGSKIAGGVPTIKRSSTPPTASKKKYPHTPYF